MALDAGAGACGNWSGAHATGWDLNAPPHTFTFGGLRIAPESGQVLDVTQEPIPGLYCAGEMVGGLFYFNYPSGTGLVSGAVFGKLAGDSAGRAALA